MTSVGVTKSDKYCGEGGNPQRVFIADAKKGWSDLKANASKHLIVGQTKLDFIKSLGSQIGWPSASRAGELRGDLGFHQSPQHQLGASSCA